MLALALGPSALSTCRVWVAEGRPDHLVRLCLGYTLALLPPWADSVVLLGLRGDGHSPLVRECAFVFPMLAVGVQRSPAWTLLLPLHFPGKVGLRSHSCGRLRTETPASPCPPPDGCVLAMPSQAAPASGPLHFPPSIWKALASCLLPTCPEGLGIKASLEKHCPLLAGWLLPCSAHSSAAAMGGRGLLFARPPSSPLIWPVPHTSRPWPAGEGATLGSEAWGGGTS